EALRIDALLLTREVGGVHRDVSLADGATGFGPRQVFASAAEAALAAGDTGRAQEMLTRLEADAERTDPGKPALRLMRLRGRLLTATGDLAGAAQQLREAEAAALRQGHLSHAWRARAELAHALLAAGDRDGARSAANGATELVEQLALHVPDGRLRQDFLERAMEHLPGRLRRRGDAAPAEGLTSREAEIAAWVARGLTNR